MEIEEQKRIAKLNGDSPAFPLHVVDIQEGLTKREYFAGLNMAAFINKPDGNSLHWYNTYAIKLADELLFQLAGENENEG